MKRLLVPKVVTVLIFVVLIARLYQLQLVDTEADKFRYATRVRTTRYLPVRPMRGEIFASDGKTLLAESMLIFTVALRPADLPPADSHQRSEVFAQLGQLLGISSTLVLSPALVFEHDSVLRSDLNQGLGTAVVAAAQRHIFSPPLNIPIPAQQSAAAVELAKRYSTLLQFRPQVVPQGAAAQATAVPQALEPSGQPKPSDTPALSGTLIISPANSLEQNSALREDISIHLGPAALIKAGPPHVSEWLSLTVPPALSMVALKLSDAYSTTLELQNPISEKVEHSDIPGYQTVTIQEDIPRNVALVLRENAPSLPGVVIDQDYRRRYPLSAEIRSLSHLLGYIGRVDECALVRKNPARSWVVGLLDSIGHAAQCGIIQKQIDPYQLGMARYLSDDRIGKDGIEASYEEHLRGQLGIEAVLVDARGRPVRDAQIVRPANNGNNLVLTIDVAFQRQVEQILRNWIDEGEKRRQLQSGTFAYKRNYAPIRSGVAIVMEVHTGRVLAMVSWPSYDNNIWVDTSRARELQTILAPPPALLTETLRLAPLTDRVIAGQYPPGSTLKQFDAAISLQKGVITPETLVRDPGKLVIEDEYVPGRFYTFPNSIPRDNLLINVSDALKVSSNVFFMSVVGGNKDHVVNLTSDEQNIERGLRIEGLAEGLRWFGFDQLSGIRLSGEKIGRVPTPAWKQQALRESWTTGDTYNAAIGQGNLEVTPLQLINAATAVANNGSLYRPQIVKAITDAGGNVIEEIAPELIRQVPVEPGYFSVVREGMRRSVSEGVNVAARDQCSGLQIAGKTGTAEFGPIVNVQTTDGRNIRQVRQSHSWFVGFAPYDNPQIEVLVLSEGTGDLGDGSATIAVPAVTQIMQAYFRITPPDPLPPGCQANMPPLPPRIERAPALMGPWSSPYGR